MNVSFDVSGEDGQLIAAIVKRFKGIYPNTDNLAVAMDLTAVHANGCNLNLGALLEAPRFDFIHDVAGIQEHIDRVTGSLTDCFLPRFRA